jgi:hypothetical protein
MTEPSMFVWVARCYLADCFMYRGYSENRTWEEAMLEALHHRMVNSNAES